MATMLGSLLVSLGLESAQFDRGLDRSQKKTQSATTAMQNSFKALAASLATAFTATEVVRLVDTYSQMTSQLRLVTDSTSQLVEVERQLFSIAQQNRVGFESTVGLYARIARSTDALGVSQAEVLQVTDTINKALVISGTSAQEASGALLQLGQAFASGALRGDELNSILEGMPRVAKAIADGMGVTVGQLRELGAQGLLTSEQVFNALLKMSKDIETEFAKMPPTVGQSFTVLGNEVLRFVGQLDQATGASATMAQAVIAIGRNLGTIITVVASLTAGFAAYRLTLIAVTGAQGAYTAAMVIATRAIGAAQAGTLGLNAAMRANPFGAVATAVGVLTASFIGLSQAQAQARVETNNLITSLRAAAQARSADFASQRAELQGQLNREQRRLRDLQQRAQSGVRMTRGGIEGSSPQAVQELAAQTRVVSRLRLELQLADESYTEAGKAAEKMVAPVAQTSAAVGNLGGSLRGASAAARVATDDFADLMEALFPENITRRQMEQLRQIEQYAERITNPFQARLRALGAEGEATVSSDLISEGPLEAARNVMAANDNIGKSLEELQGKSEDTTKVIAESFGQMADRTLQALDRMVGAIRGGGFLDILGSVINFGLQLGGMGVFGKGIQGRINAGVPGYANGTRFAPGGLAMVGERGPELVNLPRGSQVIPNRELAGMGGGGIAQIVPSPYFDVVVDGRIVRASPAIMQGGANVAGAQSARRQSRRVG